MNKLKVLLENHHQDVMVMVESLYKQKYPKKKKTICHFQALGNTYDSDIFVRNYIEFMNHITSFKSLEQLSSVMEKYISDDTTNFSDKCQKKNQAVKLKTGLYLNTYSTTKVKVGHIKRLCKDLLRCDLKFI